MSKIIGEPGTSTFWEPKKTYCNALYRAQVMVQKGYRRCNASCRVSIISRLV
jgi:hypothetical protein